MATRPSPDGSNCLTTQNTQQTVVPETCEITIENCCNMNICETVRHVTKRIDNF